MHKYTIILKNGKEIIMYASSINAERKEGGGIEYVTFNEVDIVKEYAFYINPDDVSAILVEHP